MAGPVRILVAEDEAHILLALTTVIRKGIPCDEVIGCEHGEAAWQKIQAEPFALVISDWNMPHKSGLELLQEIRGDDRTKHIPVLLLTARSDKTSVIGALQAGVSDYVTKPFDNATLVQKARKLLDSSRKQSTHSADAAAEGAPSIGEEIAHRFRNGEIVLPVLPDLATKVHQLFDAEDVDVGKLVDVIQTDPGITSKLISISNSPQYRGISEIKTLEKAISRIGIKMTENYVLVLSKRSMFKVNAPQYEALLGKLWQHSLATAEAARLVAKALGTRDADHYYTLGLLHDIGKLLLLQILAEIAKKRAISESQCTDAMEALHGEFGAALLESWKFSAEHKQVAQFHEDPTRINNPSTALLIVALANLLARRLGYCVTPGDVGEDLTQAAQRLQLNSGPMEEIATQVQTYMTSMQAAE